MKPMYYHPELAASEIMRSGRVTRYHAQPDVQAQSNAEHSWGVGALLIALFPDRVRIEPMILAQAIIHDCGEMEIGDIPSPIKRAHPDIKQIADRLEEAELQRLNVHWVGMNLSEEAKYDLKTCDILEGLQYCIRNYRITGEGAPTIRNWFTLIETREVTIAAAHYIESLRRQFNG